MSDLELKDFAVFADLSDEERAEVDALLEFRALGNGETLFCEGDEADGLVLLVGGSLEVRSERGGEERGLLEPGAALGGVSLVRVGNREATVRAHGKARVRMLRREEYRRLAEDLPRVAIRITEAVLAQVAACARGALERLAAGSVDRASLRD